MVVVVGNVGEVDVEGVLHLLLLLLPSGLCAGRKTKMRERKKPQQREEKEEY